VPFGKSKVGHLGKPRAIFVLEYEDVLRLQVTMNNA
jgi:hypothetical protein